jgi:hypothetical protein
MQDLMDPDIEEQILDNLLLKNNIKKCSFIDFINICIKLKCNYVKYDDFYNLDYYDIKVQKLIKKTNAKNFYKIVMNLIRNYYITICIHDPNKYKVQIKKLNTLYSKYLNNVDQYNVDIFKYEFDILRQELFCDIKNFKLYLKIYREFTINYDE